MILLWTAAALVLLLFLGVGALLQRNLRCGPVPDLSEPEKVRQTRWEPYAETLQKGIASIRAMPWEDVWLHDPKGLKLHGRVFHGGEETVLLAHGYRSSGENDFCGIVDFYAGQGFTVLMID